MALIKCNECGNMISDRATKCPKCGCPITKGSKPHIHQETPQVQPSYYDDKKGRSSSKWLYGIVGVLVALLVGLGLWMWNSGASGGNGQEAKIPSDAIASSQGQEKLSEDKSASNTTKTENGTTLEAHQPKKLKVSKVEFSHCLAPQAGNTYEPRNMCDGNPSTTWAVGLYNYNPYVDGFWGPIFTVKCKKLSHIIIRNGYCKDNNSYKNNARTTGISFLNFKNQDVLYEGPLKDTSKPQRLDVSSDSEGNNNLEQVGISFFDYDFIPGEKWNDLCISEVEFWGYE